MIGTPIPRGITVRSPADGSGSLIIECRWRDGRNRSLAGQAVLAGGFWVLSGFLFVQIWAREYFDTTFWIMFALLLWSMLLAVTVLLTHDVAARALNTTTICVDSQKLVVRHGPVPPKNDDLIWQRDLARLYTKVIASPSLEQHPSSFSVVAQLHDGMELDVIAELDEQESCEFIVAQIVAHFDQGHSPTSNTP